MMEGPWCRFRREARARERHRHRSRGQSDVLDPNRPIREADIQTDLADRVSAVIQAPKEGAMKSCARNSVTTSGASLGRCCLTSHAAFPEWTTDRISQRIFLVLHSGAPWRDLPDSYGPPTTCYNRFGRWRRAGIWDRIMDALAEAHDAAVQMIDTSIVRVHQHGACITQ